MAKVHCFSSFTFSYLPRALILVQTLRRIHPDWVVWAVVVDEPPAGNDCGLSREFDKVVYAKDLPFERFQSWIFRHDIVEASTAVKGEMLCHLLEEGAEKVVYLDPDIAVFGSLSGIIERLEQNSIILTPHQVDPNESEGLMKDNELTSLQFGVFNLGFLAVRNDDVGRRFARWWAKQLYFACYDDTPHGLFTDQKWCDLVPALFAKVFVERDPGYNVASWNLSKRRMIISTAGDILINSVPFKFFHFTKINSAGDIMIEKNARDNTEVFELWNWYKRTLNGNLFPEIPKGYWFYDRFDNDVKIPKRVREFFRGRSDLISHFDDPFSTSGTSFYGWLERTEPALLCEN